MKLETRFVTLVEDTIREGRDECALEGLTFNIECSTDDDETEPDRPSHDNPPSGSIRTRYSIEQIIVSIGDEVIGEFDSREIQMIEDSLNAVGFLNY